MAVSRAIDIQLTYTWNTRGRLLSARPDYPDAQAQKDAFTYDPENRRTQEDIYIWDAGNQDWVAASTLKFVYNGSQMVAELDGQNHLLQSYAWGPTGTLVSITDYTGSAPTNYQVVTDGSGSVVELLNSSTGLVAASYQYDPWGNPTSATGPAVNVSPFRWQGEFYDASFGGYYMGAREESARLHIFLSPDPSGESSDPNLYRMVNNDPINVTDPTGTTGVNMDAYRQSTQVWNEAKQQIQNTLGLSPSTPWKQVVPGTGIFGLNQKTYGDLVTSAYNDKVAWYDHGQGNVFFSGPSVTVVSDAKYAQLQAIADQPPTIGPSTLTPEQIQRQRTAQYWQGEVDAGRAMPEAAQAAWLLVASDGNLFDALHGAFKAKAPDLLAGLTGLSETSGPVEQVGPTGLALDLPLPQTYQLPAATAASEDLVGARAPALPNWHANAHGFSIRNVNPGAGTPGRVANCYNVAIAADATLAGNPAVAIPGTFTSFSALEKEYGTNAQLYWSFADIKAQM